MSTKKAPRNGRSLRDKVNKLQRYFNMKQEKKKWSPKIINLRKVIIDGEERWIEFDTEGYVIPAGHIYYDIIKGIYLKQQKGA